MQQVRLGDRETDEPPDHGGTRLEPDDAAASEPQNNSPTGAFGSSGGLLPLSRLVHDLVQTALRLRRMEYGHDALVVFQLHSLVGGLSESLDWVGNAPAQPV